MKKFEIWYKELPQSDDNFITIDKLEFESIQLDAWKQEIRELQICLVSGMELSDAINKLYENGIKQTP